MPTWEGTSGLNPPSGVGKTGAVRRVIAAPTTSAGERGPRKDETSKAAMDEGYGGQVKFGPAPGRKRPGGPNRMEFSLVLGVFCLFLLSGGTGGTRSGSPARIDHFDLGRDMVKGGKMVAALSLMSIFCT